ncbi:MAG: hypothetical protein ABSE82_03630 [Nitrososphaerales archaeon]|jgi:hydrogenase small subunit
MATNRRDFLKLATYLGAATVATYYSNDIRRVFSQTAQQNGGKIHIIWLQLASDTGCTISMLQGSNPNLIGAVQELSLSADYWQTLMTQDYDLGWVTAGYTTEDKSQVPLMNAAFGNAPVDVLVVEGSPQLGAPKGGSEGDFCRIGQYNGTDVTGLDLMLKLSAKASYVIAIGQCSSFGGIPSANGNLTGATSVTSALSKKGVTTMHPVINLAGCPAHPDWTLITLASVLQGFTPDLDEQGRPKAFFSSYIHENCPRRGAYDRGQLATTFDDPVGCYWNLGCKGPITLSSCAQTKWDGGVSFCTQGGPMCWGCMHPSFPDAPSSPFFRPAAISPEFLGLTADNFAEILLVGGVAALGVHAARHVLTGKEETGEEENVTADASAQQQKKEVPAN